MKNLQKLLEENNKRFNKIFSLTKRQIIIYTIALPVFVILTLISKSPISKYANVLTTFIIIASLSHSTFNYIKSLKIYKTISDEIYTFMILQIQLDSISNLYQSLELKI